MNNVDWGLLKVQYELYGQEPKQLAEEHGLSAAAIEYAADVGDWRHLPLAEATRDWRDLDTLEEVGDELISEVTERLRIMRTLKQATLSPQYIALETALLSKAMELIRSIDTNSPTAAAQLKSVAEVVQKLQEQNNANLSVAPPEANGSSGVTVKILSQVGAGDAQAAVGAEVKIRDRVGISATRGQVGSAPPATS